MLNPLNLRIYKTLLCVAAVLASPSFAEEKVKPIKLYDLGGYKEHIRSICHRGKEFLLYTSDPYGHAITNTGMDCMKNQTGKEEEGKNGF